MSCPFTHDDAAYVLGSLSPAERLDFERHLTTCVECARSVRDLAGLPGLLDSVDAAVLRGSTADEPVPGTLLPALTREVGRVRRRRTFAIAGLAAAVAAVAALSVPVVPGWVQDETTGEAGPSAPASSGLDDVENDVETRSMDPLGEVPVRATLGLEQVRWGTRLLLTCTYEPQSVEYALPPEVDYVLFVLARDGRAEQVGSWRSVDGTTMQVPAATSVVRTDIVSVEVRTTDGRVVLQLRA